MDITHLPQRLEISFWTAAVYIMQDRKLFRNVCMAMVAVMIVCTSLIILAIVEPSPSASASNIQPIPAGITTPVSATGQHNLLVVVVDKLNSDQPRLQSAWLALSIPRSPRLTMLPLYPAALKGGPKEDARLAAEFALTAEGAPKEGFLKILREKDLWWNHYIVVDHTALEKMVDLLGGFQLGSEQIDGKHAIEKLPSPVDYPRPALLGQATLLAQLCEGTAAKLNSSDPKRVLEAFPRHWRTDFTTEEIVGGWQNMKAEGSRLTCEFPTLTDAFPTPTVESIKVSK